MNDLEYLRQISQTNRPAKKESGLASILKSKIFKIAMGGLALVIFVMIVGSLIGQSSGKEKDSLVRVNARVTNLSSLIANYNASVKSSKLRAMGVSLSGILSETSRELFAVLQSEYNYSADETGGTIASEEAATMANTQAMLDRAKLNGVLDRSYLHQLVYEVASLISLESEAMARTDNAVVKQILENSTNSLSVLYEQLTNYSDSTN